MPHQNINGLMLRCIKCPENCKQYICKKPLGEQRSLYVRGHHEKHKEKYQEYINQYYETHKENIQKRYREYYLKYLKKDYAASRLEKRRESISTDIGWDLFSSKFNEIKKIDFSEREISILSDYLCLDNKPFLSLEQIGQKHKVTKERIRQIAARTIRKFKHPSRRKLFYQNIGESCPK